MVRKVLQQYMNQLMENFNQREKELEVLVTRNRVVPRERIELKGEAVHGRYI